MPNFMTAQDWLDRIQYSLELGGVIRKDNSREIFCFDGTSLEDGYGFCIFNTDEKLYIESESLLLERICQEIRQAKKKEKEELQNIKITNEMLTKIANDPELMQQLLAMKGC